MFTNYFTLAFRNLVKNRFFTALHLVGLGIGLATGLLLLLWVKDECSFDAFHPYADRIYRENTGLKIGDRVQVLETCPASHAAYALREIPEVERAVRIVAAGPALVRSGTLTQVENRGVFADTAFFQVFQTEILAGNPTQPFGDLNSVVLTESLARRYFGAAPALTDLLGQVLQFEETPVAVSAVVRDFPGNTLLQYDYIRPYAYLNAHFQPSELWRSREEDWGNCDDATYYRLRPGADVAAVERKLGALTHAHNPLDRGTYYQLQPLRQIHLYGADGSDGGARLVQIFSLVALFIVLIACINYLNLATARATKRAREVGLRKTVGATRGQLIAQFLVESGLVFGLSAALALALTYQGLPYANALADKNLRLDWSDPGLLFLFAGVLGGALALSAFYPALVLSAFQPLRMLQGLKGPGRDGGASGLRKGLVVVQFTCSSALLLAMFVIGRQVQFIRTKNLGYDRENVLQINLSERAYQNRDAFRQALEASPGVAGVTAAAGSLLQNRIATGDIEWDGKASDNALKISPLAVAPNFLSFFQLTLAAGNDFSGGATDANAFILNETAVRQMGLRDPVGRRLRLRETEGTVIGVVRDFHFASLHTSIQPAVFYIDPARQGVLYVKTTGQDAARAVAAAAAEWQRFEPAYPFEYTFLDDRFEQMYRQEQRTARLFQAFGGIAWLLSLLGLFALSAYTIEQRTKEIGIRKVLGASLGSIARLVAQEFMLLVGVAFLLASFLAYFFLQRWLADFAYHIELQGWMFAGAGLLAGTLALLTVGGQSLKAALADPVKALRNE